LLCKDPANRLCDLSKVQSHPYFLGTNWISLRERNSGLEVPWVPPQTESLAETPLNTSEARENAQKVIESARRAAKEVRHGKDLKAQIRESIEEMKSETSSCLSESESQVDIELDANTCGGYHLSVQSPRTSSSYGVEHVTSCLSMRSHSPKFPMEAHYNYQNAPKVTQTDPTLNLNDFLKHKSSEQISPTKLMKDGHLLPSASEIFVSQ
jgi:hypothetical protein